MYSATTYQQPFWAENSGFITGRDPLGIQNSSIALYGRLLQLREMWLFRSDHDVRIILKE